MTGTSRSTDPSHGTVSIILLLALASPQILELIRIEGRKAVMCEWNFWEDILCDRSPVPYVEYKISGLLLGRRNGGA